MQEEKLHTLTIAELAQILDAQKIPSSNDKAKDESTVISSVAYRSDEVTEDGIFFAIVGLKSDGHDYAQDAAQRGAAALITSHEIDDFGVDVYQVKDGRKAMALGGAAFYGYPAQKLQMIGLTGTNGKTTSVTLAAHLAQFQGKKAGTLGTLGARFGSVIVETANTTPESIDIQALLARAVEDELESVAMEVSSHALALDRSYGIPFDIVAFTNLTPEHLDYHKDMQDYFESKAKLFWDYEVAHRVICIDDEWGEKLALGCKERGLDYITVGRSHKADVYPQKIELTTHGTNLELHGLDGETIHIHVPLIGSFNVQNTLVAAGIAHEMGLSSQEVAEALETIPQVPGRLERVGKEYAEAVYVDYAHTQDALEKAMQAVRETEPKRLIVVFGCGGDRDTTKRIPMGKTAAHAEVAVCTSDNPRTEDPQAIIDQISIGLNSEAKLTGAELHYEVDRKKAIELAVKLAQPGDAVLIAGKGHEDYQILGTTKHHLDDREEAFKALEKHGSLRA
ncbi:MAG: UDP-N-acetylmuramoyl-L-alanyl-D-glutamate--2,6-diaminopimelate ligase [Coriobacteriia bacterium]|nr:UDP-N-acetylmuramoyl-L-alanyl-D-glutamate--2,6-diaminopimelate ligase [Coriobacteriia bacterium]